MADIKISDLAALGGDAASGDLIEVTDVSGPNVSRKATAAELVNAALVEAAGALMDANFDAQTIMVSVADNTPVAVVVPASNLVGRKATGNAGVMTAAEARTLLNVEDGAAADQTDAEIKTAYEANADTNEFSDAEQTKLAGVASGAEVNPALISQAEAEAGVATTERIFSALRVKQAIDALGSSKVLQVVTTQTGAVQTGTTLIQDDDTIPSQTAGEFGDQYLSLAITPGDTANTLIIDVILQISNGGSGRQAMALFQDTTGPALAASHAYENAVFTHEMTLRHIMAAGTTSATTFKVRAGADNTGTTTINGEGGSRLYGGVMASSITITEVAA